MRADARDFLAAPRPERPDGRKISIFPIAYTSDKCTTRICGQTASISVLLISGILGQSRSCTAPCRGRCGNRPLQTYPKPCLGGRFCPPCSSFIYVCRGRRRAQPTATKERYGCGPPLAGAHRPDCPVSPDCLFCGYTATVPPAAYFFCCARKSRQKDALGDALYCALTRANFWPLRGLNALFGRRIATIPIAFGSDECTTRGCG